ncbi:coiled-coil domain-containing protein 138-like isoform X4 [Anas acuta]|uniref:coiled-coil domain-containing protein 138-like isoform X4 n=1 Tax=Anas acuta TaxID=28680 RepID=UPI0035C91299
MLRRSKAEVECYVASVQASAASQREKSLKGFQFAKLYFELKEYELAKRYVSTYLSVQKRDPRAHRFLGQIYEAEDNIEKAFGCYRRSVELNPMQKDLVLKIAELLCNNAVTDERAKYWVEKSAKLFPGSPAVYKLKEQLLDCKAPSLAELHKYDVDNTLPSHLGKSQSNSELEVAHQNLQHETKMSQLRETLRKMTDENNELRSSLNSLRENNELLKTQQHETKMSQLRETLRKMTDENKQHETKMSQLRETLRKMTDENNELRSSLNSLRENNELLKTQHETKMSQLRETLRKMTDENNELRSSLNSLRENNELLKTQHETKMSQLRETLRKMTDENNELRSSLNSLRENNELLKTQHETKMSQLRETLRKMTDENNELRSSLNSLRENNELLKTQHETKMSQLRETLRKMTDENNELRSSLNSLRENNELLKTQHETKMSQLRETLRKMTDENNELRSSLNSLRENNELLKTQQHGTKRSQLRQPFRKMTDENNELRSSLNSLRENNELLKTQHETKMSQLRETLRKMTDENKQHETKMSQLRETLRKMTDENNELRSSLNSLRENNELLKTQHETKMSQLRETLRKMTDENNELRSSLNSLRENNELLKTQLLRISKVYDPLTILMDWISDQHLSKIEIQEEREGSEKPQCAKENYTLENCMKLLPMVTGQLQWMPFVDPKLHMSVIQFIYWSLRQIDTGSQDASMTATMERLAEVILKGAVQKGSMQKWTKKSTRSKPKAAHFFKSSSMPLRFLSTLVVLRTAKRMDYLTQAFRSLCVDLKTDEGKILFLQYRCVPIILSHLTISKKCLLFIALNALVEMAMNNDKSE